MRACKNILIILFHYDYSVACTELLLRGGEARDVHVASRVTYHVVVPMFYTTAHELGLLFLLT